MVQNTRKILKRLAARLSAYPLEEYLKSKEFEVFLQEQDLVDLWREKLGSALDEPNLYGDEAIRHAFILFLQHLLHCRQKEFPRFFSQFLLNFSQKIDRTLPIDDLRALATSFARVNSFMKNSPTIVLRDKVHSRLKCFLNQRVIRPLIVIQNLPNCRFFVKKNLIRG